MEPEPLNYKDFRAENPCVDFTDQAVGRTEENAVVGEGSAPSGAIAIANSNLAVAWEIRLLARELRALREVMVATG
jgi:hypothetical protein